MIKRASKTNGTTSLKANIPVTHLKVDTSDKAGAKKPAAKAAKANLSPEVAFRIKFQQISNKIQAAKNLDEILSGIKDEVAVLFDAERITIYGIDGVKRELVSKVMIGSDLSEIRVPVNRDSLVGYAAFKQKILNIPDAQNEAELKKIAPDLKFDDTWDKKSGFITKQVLCCPIFFHKYLMGAIQIINRKSGEPFGKTEETVVQELSKTLGIAMYNQKRAARQSGNKFSYLLKQHLITQKELKNAYGEAQKRKEPIENYLMSTVKIPKAEIVNSLSNFYEVPGVIFDATIPIPGELLKDLKVPFLQKNVWVPLRSDGDKVVMVVDDPHNLQKIDIIKSLFPKNPLDFCVALKEDILEFIKAFTASDKEQADIDDILHQLQDEEEEVEEDVDEVGEGDSAVVKLVNKIIVDAFARNASDIHIEPYPGKNATLVRIRIDGSCAVYQSLPYSYRNAVASRIKIMAGLDIAEKRLPQDGKIPFKKYYPKLDIELRVATIPTQGGLEDIVMRILAAGEPIPLKKMGFSDRNYKEFTGIITQPYGIIFVCGPTGSGKTTTLHSALAYINKPETKIWTAEDPVEITQKGLRQVQMHAKIGLTFASAMRAFLRADPDVIMVGEMRDKETTSIGIEASLTGHLVFSTLHTNSAPESVVRLLDMGMDPFNFADAVLGILAQRLARTLCSDCKEDYHPDKEEHLLLIREYGEEPWKTFGMSEKYSYSEEIKLFRPVGCEKCNGTGYRGRMGIHELLIGTDDQKRLIQTEARVEEMKAQAMKDGMTTLKMDGIEKIFEGSTDIANIRKVCIA